MTVPQRDQEQRLTALDKANAVRSYRKTLKEEVRAASRAEGIDRTVEAIEETPDLLQTMRVVDLLKSVRTFGPTKVNRTINRARISPGRTFGGLTLRQRKDLCSYLISLPRTAFPQAKS